MSGTAFHKVHYRSAELEAETVPQRAITLEGELRELLASEFGDDCSRREFKVSPDRAEKAMINNFDVLSPGVFIEVIHIDARRSLRFRVREPKPSRNANVLHRRVPDDEDPLPAEPLRWTHARVGARKRAEAALPREQSANCQLRVISRRA